MNAADVIKQMTDAGIGIQVVAGSLKLRHTQPLTDEQMAILKRHKSAIINYMAPELSPELQQQIKRTVQRLATECVRWYADDQDMLLLLSDDELQRTVLDFLSKRDWYMRKSTNDI